MNAGAFLNEFVGSFFLTAGSFMVGRDATAALAIGVGYAGLRHAFKKSKGHFNPSISFAEMISGNLNPMDFANYLVGQLLGSLVGGIIMAQINKDNLEAAGAAAVYPTLGDNTSGFQGLIIEILFTFLFVFVATAAARTAGDNLVTGFALFAALSFSMGTSGGSLNFTDTFGKFIGSSTVDTEKDVEWDDIWVYIVGPLAGGALSAGYNMLAAKFEDAEDNDKN